MRTVLCLGLLALVLSFADGAAAAGPDANSLLPAGAQARIAALGERFGVDTMWRQARDHALARVIDPNDYECGPTDFDEWIFMKFGAIQDWPAFVAIANLGALDWATYYSLLFDNDASDDYMGVDGGQTREMTKRHKDAKRFWAIDSDDIQLQGMHGIDLADDEKMNPVVQLLLGVDEATAALIIDFVQSVIEADPGLGYDNPLFTLNAFAFTAEGEDPNGPFAGVPDKIVMGDGISEALADLDLGENAPDFVHAHEFGHHVQFELGVFGAYDGTPEFTRYTELMADAFGAYFCAHARGAAFQAQRIVEGFRASYIIGDCAFGNPGHHGTPNQREAAALWGAERAAAAQKQGHIESPESLLAAYDAYFPTLIAPDAK